MALPPGTRLGAFEILTLVGAGGMGEVYRARDTRLDRTVALKIVRDAGNEAIAPRRLERFRQEARAVARITHPHICTLHDVCDEGGATFLVMEFVEGTTLARRLEDGPLPLAATLKIAVQIADALDHAHRHGVVHRDLNPSNVMLARDRVKLLDFGLAKLKEPDEREAVCATTETRLTETRMLIGTAPYMAPEQINGREADARTDLFAFGVVLYEMLAGRRPFAGDSWMAVLAAITIAEPPSLSGLQPGTPPAVERLVARCLAKDPDDRWQTARDLAAELRWLAESSPAHDIAQPPMRRRSRREAVAWAAAIAFAISTLGLLATRNRVAPASAPPVMRFTVSPPDDGAIASVGVGGSPVAVSPNGRHIAFLATARDGVRHLYVRSLDGVASQRLSGTDGALQPFWSPDSQSIGFFAGDRLRRISIAGGEPQTICDAPAGPGGGATWNQDGVILFSPLIDGTAVHRVSATGGTPTPVTRLDPALHDTAHIWPSFLPDGRHFFFERLAGDQTGIYVQSLDSGEAKLLVRTPFTSGAFANMPVFAAPRYLLYGRRGALIAQAFDLERLEPIGEPFQVAENLDTVGPSAAFSVSETGVLAYWSGGSDTTQLTWVDRIGRSIGTVGAPGSYAHLALSPDAARVAVAGTGPDAGVWVLEIGRGAFARLTTDVFGSSPVWSPDGAAILFAGVRDTPPNLFVKRLAAAGDAERLIRMNVQHFPTYWSPDGQSAVFMTIDPTTKRDLWRVPMPRDRTPVRLLHTQANESHGRISPDSRWLAYDSDESGRSEVYVTSYPQPGRKWLVSIEGGANAVWRRDGRELYYESADRKLMAAPVKTGPSFEPGVPAPLFELNVPPVAGVGFGWSYDIAPDGRFLVNTVVDRSSPPLTVVVNWLTEIGRR